MTVTYSPARGEQEGEEIIVLRWSELPQAAFELWQWSVAQFVADETLRERFLIEAGEVSTLDLSSGEPAPGARWSGTTFYGVIVGSPWRFFTSADGVTWEQRSELPEGISRPSMIDDVLLLYGFGGEFRVVEGQAP